MMYKINLLFYIFSIANGLENGLIETFIVDIIGKWKLLSPTIIFQDEMPTICMQLQWSLCLKDDMSTTELAEHLGTIFKSRKQDGIIFVGGQGHKKLLKQLSEVSKSIFSSNSPVFMPTDYTNEIHLRLDSNVVFYKEEAVGTYNVIDKFAVKDGPIIIEDLGYWNSGEGLILHKSINRWNRRSDLKGTSFQNGLFQNGQGAQFIKDTNGKIIGSNGWFQDMLFYITDKLNLTVETVEAKKEAAILLENGTWTGYIGLLQRKEVDVLSLGLVIDLRSPRDVIDYPIATHRTAITLISAIPKGTAPNMWVYIRVFGVYQWIIFITILTMISLAFTLLSALSDDDDERSQKFGTKRGAKMGYKLNTLLSCFAFVYLYVIQMGSHTTSRQLASMILTLSTSMLTLLTFIYYATDITAEMTFSPSDIPIRTFEDVIHHNYKVITTSPSSERILKSAKPGTPKNVVYTSYFKNMDVLKGKTRKEIYMNAINEILTDPKSLLYVMSSSLASPDPILDKVFALKMDDAVYGSLTLGLQKNSEFLQIFNHYILKEIESGYLRRLYLKYHAPLFTRENYETMDAQPLRFQNVMFCFVLLGVGVCFSIAKAMMEFIVTKLTKEHLWAVKTRRNQKKREKREEMIDNGKEGQKGLFTIHETLTN